MTKMQPTLHLRFVIRDVIIARMETHQVSRPIKILQQWWSWPDEFPNNGPASGVGQWRDVELEDE